MLFYSTSILQKDCLTLTAKWDLRRWQVHITEYIATQFALSLLNILQTVAETVSLSSLTCSATLDNLDCLNDSTIQAWKPRFICTCVLLQKKGKIFSQYPIFVSGNLWFLASFQLSFTSIWYYCTVWKWALRTTLL